MTMMKTSLFLLFLLITNIQPIIEGSKCEDDVISYVCPIKSCGQEEIHVRDCLDCKGYLNKDDKNGRCFRRTLFDRFLAVDIIGMIVWFVAAGVATACGVGGGGIYVPLGIILLQFASKPSSGLSQASIFGASLGGFILNIRNRHPDTKIRDTIGQRDEEGRVIPYDLDLTPREIEESEEEYLNSDGDGGRKFYTRPLIDYDMALFLSPLEMAGAVLGVLVQKLMPNWLFLSLAGIILGITSYKTYQKFVSSYKKDKENRERKRRLAQGEEAMDGQDQALDNAVDAKEDGTSGVNDDATDLDEPVDVGSDALHEDHPTPATGEASNDIQDTEEKLAARRALLEADSRQYPPEKLMYLVILWIGLAVITFLKGGKGVDSIIGIHCNSPIYGLLIAMQFIWTLGYAVVFGFKLVKKQEERNKVHYPFHSHDVLWNGKKLREYAIFTFVAGIVAGLIGIGGGMVLGPLMLIMGVHPRVSSATTATMIILTSSSVAVMFIISGLVPWEYAISFFLVCLSGAYVGKKYIDEYIKKTDMSSILIGILATIIGFATIGCFVIVFVNLDKNHWCPDGFKKFCDYKQESELCNIYRELSWIDTEYDYSFTKEF